MCFACENGQGNDQHSSIFVPRSAFCMGILQKPDSKYALLLLSRISRPWPRCHTPPLLPPSHCCYAKCGDIDEEYYKQHPPPCHHGSDPVLDLVARRLVRKREIPYSLEPSLRCPTKLWVVHPDRVNGDRLADVLVCRLIRHHKGKDEARQGEQNREKEQDGECSKTL